MLFETCSRRARALATLAVVSTLAVACTGSESSVAGGTTTDGGIERHDDDGGFEPDASDGGPRADPKADAATDAASKQPPKTDLLVQAGSFYAGTFWITGTISMPAQASAAYGVQLKVSLDGSSGGEFINAAGASDGAKPLTYAITGLKAGSYTVQAIVDANKSNTINAGDYTGFARGTTDSPIVDVADANEIVVNGNVTGVDFGLGIMP